MGDPVFETWAELEAWIVNEWRVASKAARMPLDSQDISKINDRIRRVVANHSHLKDAAP